MNITVLISHWPRHVARFDYFIATVHSLFEYLPPSTKQHCFRFWAGIEQQQPGSQMLLNAVTAYCRHRHINVAFNITAAGVGRNLNMLMERVETPYVLYFQDDFVLKRPLPLDADIELLERANPFSLIRYAAHERTLEDASVLGGEGDLLLRAIPCDAFYYWSFNPFLAKTDALRVFFGPFPDERNAENLMNQRLRTMDPHHQILVRGSGAIHGSDCLVHHIGDKTSILEKFSEEQLRQMFGDQIPTRVCPV